MTHATHTNDSFLETDFGPPKSPRLTAADDAVNGDLCAAEYVRMSTEHQRYSIESQTAAIAAYAAKHKISIVRSYIDPGRSGLRIEHRHALRQLIEDVQSGQANFNTILVYDVSRWGRFQDTDEGAYYEFLCKKAGAPVHYCAEQFENNGTLIDQIVKGLKRAMAGEYSRELSVKVFEAQKRGALRGLHQGGTPAYGFRRLLVDEFGKPRTLLRTSERKHFQTDHVVLTLGPASEIKITRRIFRLFVLSRMPRRHIARLLNEEGVPNAIGNQWTDNNVLRILTNEKYIGNVIYARTSQKLLGPSLPNPPETWVRANGALQRTIDPEIFVSAQRILGNPWWAFTDNQLLDRLTAALCKYGYLSTHVITKSKFTPAAVTYQKRFGSLMNAYRLIGYKPIRGYYHCKPDFLRPMHRNLVSQLISDVERQGGTVQFDETSQTLQLNGTFTVSVVIIPYLRFETNVWGWTLRLRFFPKCDLILAGRLDKANTRILNYYLLPRSVCSRTVLQFTERNLVRFKSYKLQSLAAFYAQCKKLSLHIPTTN